MQKVFTGLLLIVAVLTSVISPNNQALADHPSSMHNKSIHSSNNWEWVCVDTKSSTTWTWKSAFNEVRDALVWDGSDVWDGTASNKIDFAFENSTQCSDPGTDLSSMEMRTYIMDTTPCSPSSCNYHYTSVGSHDGYTDYDYEKVFIRSADLTNVTNYIVSHEFGHSLGLSDGDGTCPGSIMHSADYGCSGYPSFPTNLDRQSVTDLANLTP